MEQGERRAKELGVLFIESSAKTGHNVKQVFIFLLLFILSAICQSFYSSFKCICQLFRRVAAALPGLDVNKEQEKGNEVNSIILPQEEPKSESNCGCWYLEPAILIEMICASMWTVHDEEDGIF